jgi:type VI protein secretion system component VasK
MLICRKRIINYGKNFRYQPGYKLNLIYILTFLIICVTFSVYFRHIAQTTVMLRQEKTRVIVSSVLIIISLVFIGYRTSQKLKSDNEACSTRGQKEQQEIRVKSALPIFESLSRHLITIQ